MKDWGGCCGEWPPPIRASGTAGPTERQAEPFRPALGCWDVQEHAGLGWTRLGRMEWGGWSREDGAGAAFCPSLEGCGLLSRLDRQTQATTLVHQIFGGYLRSRGK